jgi:pilus assembly protein CpaC
VRTMVGITIACCSALSFVLCAESPLQAQTAPLPAQPAESAAASVQDSTNELYVSVGKTVLVDLAKPIARVSIGLGEVAEAHVVTRSEVMVNGKTPGETSLIIWDTKGGRQFFNVTVRASTSLSNDNLDAVRRELRAELPGQTVRITADNGSIFLRGNVKDLISSQRAVQIATAGMVATAGSTTGKVINLLNVDVPPADPQILLKVRFMSVDRSLEKQFGINLFSTGFGNTLGGTSTGQFSPPTVSLASASSTASAAISNELNLFAFYPGLNLGATIQALETKGIVETLAEPNVLAVNGKEASFLAGGEYPYPVAQATAGGAATITIQFKEYGIRLNFIPTLTPRGTIRLQVAPEVSALDFTHAVEISGFEVPAITSRKMKTEVELGDGQSFVLGGLLDNEETDSFNKVPFLGDIPILGKLFQSSQRTKTNTELLVLVTPEIVAPIQAGAPVPTLKYPVKFMPPNSGIPMNTPDAKTADNTQTPPPATIPIEKLIESMRPEAPLVIEGTGGGFGAGSGGISSAPSTPPPTP